MRKLAKMLSIILIAMMILTFSTGVVKAADDYDSTIDSIFSEGSANTSNLEGVGANIVDIVTTIGIIVAVVVLLVLGIKYMMGSASEKAEYKKTMIPYLIGAILIFGASAIAKAVIQMSKLATNS